MKKTLFILHEKFRSETSQQRRKEQFQKEFERYILDRLSTADPSEAHV